MAYYSLLASTMISESLAGCNFYHLRCYGVQSISDDHHKVSESIALSFHDSGSVKYEVRML